MNAHLWARHGTTITDEDFVMYLAMLMLRTVFQFDYEAFYTQSLARLLPKRFAETLSLKQVRLMHSCFKLMNPGPRIPLRQVWHSCLVLVWRNSNS